MIVYANRIEVLDLSVNLYLFKHQVASIPTSVFWDDLIDMDAVVQGVQKL